MKSIIPTLVSLLSFNADAPAPGGGGSPAAAAEPAAAKPAAEVKPAEAAKPAAEAKAEIKPAAEVKPAAEAKQTAEAKPAAEVKPAAKAEPKPAVDPDKVAKLKAAAKLLGIDVDLDSLIKENQESAAKIAKAGAAVAESKRASSRAVDDNLGHIDLFRAMVPEGFDPKVAKARMKVLADTGENLSVAGGIEFNGLAADVAAHGKLEPVLVEARQKAAVRYVEDFGRDNEYFSDPAVQNVILELTNQKFSLEHAYEIAVTRVILPRLKQGQRTAVSEDAKTIALVNGGGIVAEGREEGKMFRTGAESAGNDDRMIARVRARMAVGGSGRA